MIPERLARALHPLAQAPTGEAWNHAELRDLLPDGGRGLRQAAVLVGLVDRPAGTTVLLTRRTEALRHHAGQVSFPGGAIEPDDVDPAAAALREAAEEVGLAQAQVQPLGYLDPFATITGFHVHPLVARIDPCFAPVADAREVDEVFEVPFAFLMQPDNARRLDVEYRGSLRKVIEFQYQGYRIWGATAAVLVNLRTRLEAVP